MTVSHWPTIALGSIAVAFATLVPASPGLTAAPATVLTLPPGVSVAALIESAEGLGPVVISGCAPGSRARLQVSFEFDVATGADPHRVPILLAPNLATDAEGSASLSQVLPRVTTWLGDASPAVGGRLRFSAACLDPALPEAVEIVPYASLGAPPPTGQGLTGSPPTASEPLTAPSNADPSPTGAASDDESAIAMGIPGPAWIAIGTAGALVLLGTAFYRLRRRRSE
ncbi:hypothetical protein GH740_09810 [Microbacterium sp. SYP-A9085]|uniref:hypothetical protein n=1 Tax=Microbacterium sp. SYP-A9085 TaxID=2664454 RepID=UPI00129A80FB|nr:hypothetical protein [Microbacterium sp. SYP-A9085]MRH29607.1 hypothetical protein [Microbacterium sp. SYP-A9085]